MKMAGIGVNLRVTGHCNQGGRKYMEDMFSVAYQQTIDLKDLEYAFFGIFDGHGGPQAAAYAKENLLDNIVNQRNFWSDNDADVLMAIREGFITTHYSMWKELGKWPKTQTGLPSTSGTTATIAFIMKGKVYYGHVGDTAILLGYKDKDDPKWKAKLLTTDHKPEQKEEYDRILNAGGKVVVKSGVPRVVWNRPRLGHQGPVRRSTPIDEVPFLAVARSLGDFWSYNSQLDEFIVSPVPDVGVHTVDVSKHKCLIFGTDGLWNMMDPTKVINIVHRTEVHNEKQVIYNASYASSYNQQWLNPSKILVDKAIDKWVQTKQRADNTSVVTLMLDPPGPPRAQVLLNQKKKIHAAASTQDQKIEIPNTGGVAIFTRFPGGVTKQHSPTSIGSDPNNPISVDPKKGFIGRKPKSVLDRTDIPFIKQESSSKSPQVLEIEKGSIKSEEKINQISDSNYSPLKRRTRSEDKPMCEEGSSDAENQSLRWPCDGKSDGKKRKINMEIKRTKVRRATLSTVGKVQEQCKSRALEETTRTLRSDTQAAIPIKTLRSRNVDLRKSVPNISSFYDNLKLVGNIKSEVKLENGVIGGVAGTRATRKYNRTSYGQSSSSKCPPQWSPAMSTRSHGNKSLNS